ncbi:hypothetical protein TorRG33x02_017600 [Trema orientale]|uniref:Uncharacterized protein n=1 Tax=Trema orientale TaxID=63057 RepID=A0A2P5FYD2_TREOI|nr:hypothetical protein TorRG33x02_017600 [Trema orientale]
MFTTTAEFSDDFSISTPKWLELGGVSLSFERMVWLTLFVVSVSELAAPIFLWKLNDLVIGLSGLPCTEIIP